MNNKLLFAGALKSLCMNNWSKHSCIRVIHVVDFPRYCFCKIPDLLEEELAGRLERENLLLA